MSDATGAFVANLAPEQAKSPQARVAGAMRGFAQEIGALSAFRLESCIHCGICADACHFYIATEDPQYTPIWKVEPFKQAYKREASPFAPLFRLFGSQARSHGGPTGALAASAVRQLQHVRPLQPDLSRWASMSRRSSSRRATPCSRPGSRRRSSIRRRRISKRPASRSRAPSPIASSCSAIGKRFGVEIPLDKPEADVHAVRAADRHRALPERGRGAGASHAASGRLVHLSQRRAGRGELRLLRGRQELAARHQPAADRAGHRLQGQDSARPRMRPRLHARCAGRRPICTASRCLSRYATSPNSSPTSSQAGRLKLDRAADRQDHLPRSLPAGAQGRRQRCAARAHAGDGHRAATN